MNFRAHPGYFLRDGKPFFLLSGEIHYFRIEPSLWEKHLVQLKRSGANATSTYIPWDWHEPEENSFDFSGSTDPGKDLTRYIELCRKVGLLLIVKPGPYILAEYTAHGLPGWLLQRCTKNARALDEEGRVIAPDVMSYMSEEFLRCTFHWYDQIMPLIAGLQESRGGPIIMMQVCNEVGVFQWLSGKVDYNPSVTKLYRKFLAELHGSIDVVNRLYGTHYPSFEEVEPPRGVIGARGEYCAYYDFHLFYRHYFAMYLRTLSTRIRSYGIDLQLSHNIPGWIYGNASELPMLISTYDKVMKTERGLAFGLDHIPEFTSFRNAHADLACNKILEAMQHRSPVWAAEFQAGSREHHVRCDPRDMELFYFASLAHGLKGLNFYMFSQGVNPPEKGFNGRKFYYQTPLDALGRRSALYAVTRKLAAFVTREGKELLTVSTRARICAGFYRPYFATELTTSQLLRERRLQVGRLGLSLDPRFVREELFFQGLLRGLQTLNLAYDVGDLQEKPLEDFLRYRQLWVVTTEFMDRATQAFLAEYVQRGGHLVLYPAVPSLDEYLTPCTTLRDALELRCASVSGPVKVAAFDIDEVYTVGGWKQRFEVADEEVVSTMNGNEACGVRKRVGKGWILALGFAFGYSTEEHLQLYARIASLDRMPKGPAVSDPDIQWVLRQGKKRSYLFLLNYHNLRKVFTVDGKKHSLAPTSYKVIIRK